MTEKNLTIREGWDNRHNDGLPQSVVNMKIINIDYTGETIFLCEWTPFNADDYPRYKMPSEGFLGSAKVISGDQKGSGFNVWKQNDSEFIYYKVV
ncbi:MAG: hypothetical protein ACI9AT_000426 [Ulvibacter sp.]|jgi:hypothetical protein